MLCSIPMEQLAPRNLDGPLLAFKEKVKMELFHGAFKFWCCQEGIPRVAGRGVEK